MLEVVSSLDIALAHMGSTYTFWKKGIALAVGNTSTSSALMKKLNIPYIPPIKLSVTEDRRMGYSI